MVFMDCENEPKAKTFLHTEKSAKMYNSEVSPPPPPEVSQIMLKQTSEEEIDGEIEDGDELTVAQETRHGGVIPFRIWVHHLWNWWGRFLESWESYLAGFLELWEL